MTSIDVKPILFEDLQPNEIICLQECLKLDYTGTTVENVQAQLQEGKLSGVRVTQDGESLVLLFNLFNYPAGRELWVWTVLGRFAHRRNFAKDFILKLAQGLGCSFISGQASLTTIKQLWRTADAQEVATIYRMDLK